MTESGQASEDPMLRSFAVYQDALVRIADIVRQGEMAEPLTGSVRDICYRAHQEVATILGIGHVDPRGSRSESPG